jgi:hypothetical protein
MQLVNAGDKCSGVSGFGPNVDSHRPKQKELFSPIRSKESVISVSRMKATRNINNSTPDARAKLRFLSRCPSLFWFESELSAFDILYRWESFFISHRSSSKEIGSKIQREPDARVAIKFHQSDRRVIMKGVTSCQKKVEKDNCKVCTFEMRR